MCNKQLWIAVSYLMGYLGFLWLNTDLDVEYCLEF